MKKYLLPLFLLLAATVNLNSCKDDDDPAPEASIVVSINNSAVENNGSIELKKGTILAKEGTEGKDDLLTLSITSTDGSAIKNIQLTVTNSYEYNVDVVDVDGVAYNKKTPIQNAPSTKNITFVGVYGEYTAIVETETGSKIYKFNVKNAEGNKAYDGNDLRYISNKQTIIFDSSDEFYAKSIIGLTYEVKTQAGKPVRNFGEAQLYSISAERYEELQGSKGTFYLEAGDLEYSTIANLEEGEYLVYKNGDKFYFLHLIELKDNTLKAEIQY